VAVTPEKVLKILNDISSGDPHVWVAGSAAICPALANDVDIWVLGASKLKPKAFNPEVWASKPPLDFDPNYVDVIQGITTKREATIPSIAGSEAITIQVMFTTWADIYEGLKQFDCSCHVWARGWDGRLAATADSTLPGKPIKELTAYKENYFEESCSCSVCSAYKTKRDWYLQRVEEFTQRYANTAPDLLWLPT
jgi:hypothetical protein